MLTPAERRFVLAARVARLSSVGPGGTPLLGPVGLALVEARLYVPIDEKPKRPGAGLQRLRNLAARPQAAVLVDRYDEDWRQLAWVMLRGPTEILTDGEEHAAAQAAARARYPQLRAMRLEGLPVIALRIARVASWGALDPV